MTAIAFTSRISARLSFGGVLAAELIKLRSLRTIRVAFLAVVLLCGIGMLLGAANFSVDAHEGPLGASVGLWRDIVQAGGDAGDVGVLVFAALVGGTEFTTRSVVTSFVAAPTRLAVITAKGIVTVAAVVVASVIGTVLGMTAAVPVMAGVHVAPPTADAIGYCLANVAQLAIIALVLLPIGVLTRSTAAAMAFGFVALFVTLLLIPHVSTLVGVDLSGTLLSTAVDGVTSPLHAPGLTPYFWRDLPAAVLWIVVPWIAAGLRTVRRDV
jgi:ABC-2 type transport system permease protein